jgi:hypothetical protein
MPRKANETKKKEIKEPKEKNIDIKSIEIELNNYLEDRKVDIEKELTNKIDEQIELKVTKRMKEEEKKLSRGKTGKIIRRDIIIILLLGVIGYFCYCLYDVDYFNIRTKVVDKTSDNKKDDEIKNNDKEEDNNEPIVDTKPDSSYYIKNYGYLLDNLLINDEEIYNLFTKTITRETIPNELVLKIAYKNINKVLITNNNDMITFHKDSLLESAKKIFGEDINIKNEMFIYNNIKFMYYNDTYIGLKEESNSINLINKIINANEENNELTFEFIIAKTSENKLLDIEDNIIEEEYDNKDITEYKDKLSTYIIVFEKSEDNYIFKNITRK